MNPAVQHISNNVENPPAAAAVGVIPEPILLTGHAFSTRSSRPEREIQFKNITIGERTTPSGIEVELVVRDRTNRPFMSHKFCGVCNDCNLQGMYEALSDPMNFMVIGDSRTPTYLVSPETLIGTVKLLVRAAKEEDETVLNVAQSYERDVILQEPSSRKTILVLDRKTNKTQEENALPGGHQPDNTVTWVDIESPTDQELDELMAKFHVDPGAMQECRRGQLDDFVFKTYGRGNNSRHLFAVLHSLSTEGSKADDFRADPIRVFAGHGWIITLRDKSSPLLDELKVSFKDNPKERFARQLTDEDADRPEVNKALGVRISTRNVFRELLSGVMQDNRSVVDNLRDRVANFLPQLQELDECGESTEVVQSEVDAISKFVNENIDRLSDVAQTLEELGVRVSTPFHGGYQTEELTKMLDLVKVNIEEFDRQSNRLKEVQNRIQVVETRRSNDAAIESSRNEVSIGTVGVALATLFFAWDAIPAFQLTENFSSASRLIAAVAVGAVSGWIFKRMRH